MTKTFLLTVTIAVLFAATALTTVVYAEGTKDTMPNWTFTEEQLRLFNPPLDADAEAMLQWITAREFPTPEDTEPWGGPDKYREHIQLIKIMACRAILAADPPFVLKRSAWSNLHTAHHRLCILNQDEWLPKTKVIYDELTALSRERGEVLDEQATLHLFNRTLFFRTIIERDKNFLPYGEELLGEADDFIRKYHGFDHLGWQLYNIKNIVLQAMGTADEGHAQTLADFVAERRELIRQNEDRLQSVSWYTWLYPFINSGRPYDTPEQQEEARRVVEKFQHLIATNEETQRFDADGIELLYRWLRNLFHSLVFGDAENIPKLQAFIDTLEKAALENPGDPQLNKALYDGYLTFWNVNLHYFSRNGGSNDDLVLIFDAMIRFLEVAGDLYDNAGHWLNSIPILSMPPFEKCTPEQQIIFIDRFGQVVAKMEIIEKAWKDAGRPVMFGSHVPLLQEYLARLQLPGQEISLTGTTLNGEAFDLDSLRGKIVLLNFWATWCGPCIAEIPTLKERYEEFHARGFEIVGISIDTAENKETLVEFVQSRQLPWVQLHDPRRELFQQLYGRGVPYCLLLDREGKVILQDARGERLTRKLEEVFAE